MMAKKAVTKTTKAKTLKKKAPPAFLKGVKYIGRSPKIIMPWGFRIVEFQGEKVLRPLTPEEFRKETGKEPGYDCVMTNNIVCEKQDCTKRVCKMNNGTVSYCVCVN